MCSLDAVGKSVLYNCVLHVQNVFSINVFALYRMCFLEYGMCSRDGVGNIASLVKMRRHSVIVSVYNSLVYKCVLHVQNVFSGCRERCYCLLPRLNAGCDSSSATLQRTATHGNTLQQTATHCNRLQHTATHCDALQRTATHCNELQHTATHCSNGIKGGVHK